MKTKALLQIFVLALLIFSVVPTALPVAAKPEAVPMLAKQTVINYQAPCKSGIRAGVTTWHDSGSLARYAYDWVCENSNEVYAPHGGVVKFTRYYSDSTHGMVMIYDGENNVCISMLHLNSAFNISVGDQVTTDTKLGSYTTSEGHTHLAVNPGLCSMYDHANEQPIIFNEIGYVLSQKITINGTIAGSEGKRVWVTDGGSPNPRIPFGSNAHARQFFDQGNNRLNLEVCADNLAGNTLYVKSWRNAGFLPDKSAKADSNCYTFWDLDGAGPAFTDVPYRTWVSMGNSPDANWGFPCLDATGREGMCTQAQYPSEYTDPVRSVCTPGKSVDATFFADVITKLNAQTDYPISNNEFAVKALQAWQPYEGTNACWNPLATTWKRPGSTDFNSVGVQNYSDSTEGAIATANTLGLTNDFHDKYTAIRKMLALTAFDEAGLTAGLQTWGGGGYAASLISKWRPLYDQYKGGSAPAIHTHEQIYWNNTYTGNVDTMNYDKWPFQFTDTRDFTITATRISGDMALRLTLLDAAGSELTHVDGADVVNLTGNRPAGNYAVLIQPISGSGAYSIKIVHNGISTPSASLTCSTTNVTVGDTFTCTLSVDPAGKSIAGIDILGDFNGLLKLNSTTFTELAGPEPISLGGRFVMAGSSGYQITQSGDLATLNFTATGAGTVNFAGTGTAADESNAPVSLTLTGPTITIQSPDNPWASVSGKIKLDTGINPSRAVATLVDASNNVIANTPVDSSGNYTFNQITPGTYTLRISTPGYMTAQKSVMLVAGENPVPEVTLLAGDLNGDGKIDPLDVASFGKSYKTNSPPCDLNGDGIVNLFDLTLLARNWRKSPISW